MESRTTFVTSGDGTRVACGLLGQGFPLVSLQIPALSHCRLDLTQAPRREFFERLARRRKVIRADLRGSGLADRDVRDHSVEAFVADLKAIFGALGIVEADLLASGVRTPVAVRFAAQYPEQVRRLVLVRPAVGKDGALGWPWVQGSRGLRTADWVLYTEVLAARAGADLRTVGDTAAYMRQCADQRNLVAELDAIADFDPRADPPLLRCSTLIVAFPQSAMMPIANVDRFAELVPHAELVYLPEASNFGYLQDLAAAIEHFTAPGRETTAADHALSPREEEVLVLVAAGKTNAQVGKALVISEATAARHVHNVLTKLGVSNRTEAAAWAARNGVGDGRT